MIPVYGLEVEGSSHLASYTTSLSVLYSLDGSIFSPIYDNTNHEKVLNIYNLIMMINFINHFIILFQVFRTNVDSFGKVKIMFPYPVEARYIRLYPKSWKKNIAIKFDVIGCTNIYSTLATIIKTLNNFPQVVTALMNTEISNLDDIITSDIKASDKMHALKDQIPQMNDKLINMYEEGIVSDTDMLNTIHSFKSIMSQNGLDTLNELQSDLTTEQADTLLEDLLLYKELLLSNNMEESSKLDHLDDQHNIIRSKLQSMHSQGIISSSGKDNINEVLNHLSENHLRENRFEMFKQLQISLTVDQQNALRDELLELQHVILDQEQGDLNLLHKKKLSKKLSDMKNAGILSKSEIIKLLNSVDLITKNVKKDEAPNAIHGLKQILRPSHLNIIENDLSDLEELFTANDLNESEKLSKFILQEKVVFDKLDNMYEDGSLSRSEKNKVLDSLTLLSAQMATNNVLKKLKKFDDKLTNDQKRDIEKEFSAYVKSVNHDKEGSDKIKLVLNQENILNEKLKQMKNDDMISDSEMIQLMKHISSITENVLIANSNLIQNSLNEIENNLSSNAAEHLKAKATKLNNILKQKESNDAEVLGIKDEFHDNLLELVRHNEISVDEYDIVKSTVEKEVSNILKNKERKNHVDTNIFLEVMTHQLPKDIFAFIESDLEDLSKNEPNFMKTGILRKIEEKLQFKNVSNDEVKHIIGQISSKGEKKTIENKLDKTSLFPHLVKMKEYAGKDEFQILIDDITSLTSLLSHENGGEEQILLESKTLKNKVEELLKSCIHEAITACESKESYENFIHQIDSLILKVEVEDTLSEKLSLILPHKTMKIIVNDIDQLDLLLSSDLKDNNEIAISKIKQFDDDLKDMVNIGILSNDDYGQVQIAVETSLAKKPGGKELIANIKMDKYYEVLPEHVIQEINDNLLNLQNTLAGDATLHIPELMENKNEISNKLSTLLRNEKITNDIYEDIENLLNKDILGAVSVTLNDVEQGIPTTIFNSIQGDIMQLKNYSHDELNSQKNKLKKKLDVLLNSGEISSEDYHKLNLIIDSEIEKEFKMQKDKLHQAHGGNNKVQIEQVDFEIYKGKLLNSLALILNGMPSTGALNEVLKDAMNLIKESSNKRYVNEAMHDLLKNKEFIKNSANGLLDSGIYSFEDYHILANALDFEILDVTEKDSSLIPVSLYINEGPSEIALSNNENIIVFTIFFTNYIFRKELS